MAIICSELVAKGSIVENLCLLNSTELHFKDGLSTPQKKVP